MVGIGSMEEITMEGLEGSWEEFVWLEFRLEVWIGVSVEGWISIGSILKFKDISDFFFLSKKL